MFRNLLTAIAILAFSTGVSAQTTDANALAKAREIGTKNRASKRYYTKVFDLNGLPKYQPKEQVTGTIRQWGNNYIQDSGLSQIWEDEFRKYQPNVKFQNNLSSSAVAFPGLITDAADLAPMGRQALWDELKGFEREGAADSKETEEIELVEITMATGSLDVRGWTWALGIFVHKDNPLKQLTLEQLDGIFGAERSGGWNGLNWETSRARGKEKNIRTWGQLGLKGGWAKKPINVYGYNFKYHFTDEFDKKVLQASGKWNESLKMYSNVAGLKTDGTITGAGELMMNDLSKDKFGIAYTGMPFITPQTRPLALSKDGKTFVELNLDNVQNRTYPLTRDVYFYVKRIKGKPIDPKVKEFLRYVLSREGQDAVMKDGKYLPLTAEAAREQLRKLE